MIAAYEEKYGVKKKRIDFYWLDDDVEEIQLGEDHVTIQWRDGEASVIEMNVSEERFFPTRYSVFYNHYLDRVRRGEKKNKYKHLMGLGLTSSEPEAQKTGIMTNTMSKPNTMSKERSYA